MIMARFTISKKYEIFIRHQFIEIFSEISTSFSIANEPLLCYLKANRILGINAKSE